MKGDLPEATNMVMGHEGELSNIFCSVVVFFRLSKGYYLSPGYLPHHILDEDTEITLRAFEEIQKEIRCRRL